MANIPKFSLYGEDNPAIETNIQPRLELRKWSELSDTDKETAYRQLLIKKWVGEYSPQVLATIEELNEQYLRILPGKELHSVPPVERYGYGGMLRDNTNEKLNAAQIDFKTILLTHDSDALIYRMITIFAGAHIDRYPYSLAEKVGDQKEREEYIVEAFDNFDRLAICLNHIFEQFSVNVILTREGLVPRQDDKIAEDVYIPTLQILAHPKWKTVSNDLAKMFDDYHEGKFPETITKAHSAVQRFLQILVGEEGRGGQGEMGKLFAKAKKEGVIPVDRFTEPLITVLASYFPSERATNSTAKPTTKDTTSSDALLMMNLVMVFLQHSLQGK